MRPKFSISFALLLERGRGEDRVRAAPAVSQACSKRICCPRAYRFSGEHTGLPHATALRLIRDRPGDPAFCDTIALGQLSPPSNLTPASGRRTQSISPYAKTALVSRGSASIASHRTVVTIAIAPLVAVDGAIKRLIWPDDQAEYFRFRGLTQFPIIGSDFPVGLLCRRASLRSRLRENEITFQSGHAGRSDRPTLRTDIRSRRR